MKHKNDIITNSIKHVLKNKWYYIALVFVVIIILFISSGGDISSIPSYTVQKSDFIISITESGEMKAASNFTILAPRVWGKLRIVNMAAEGTLVKEGDMLVQFDPTEMLKLLTDKENELIIQKSEARKFNADQEANMARLEADVDNARITFELSKLNAERMKFESESQQKQSELELERNRNSYEGSKQRIESQKIITESDFSKLLIREKQIVGDVEKVRVDMDALTIKAPMQGLVVYEFNWQTDKKFSIGDEPWPGSSLISLPDLSKVQVTTMVNEIDVSKVQVGQDVKVKLDAFPDRMFSGQINSVATIGKNKDNNATVKVFDVLIDVNEVDPVFKPGMTTNNEIITEIIPDVISVPLEAVFERDSKTIVYKITGSSIQPVEITLGKKNSDFVIIEKGLKSGDVVALKNPMQKDDEQSGTKTSASSK
jgi:RND family efflux transporter MFP subunit